MKPGLRALLLGAVVWLGVCLFVSTSPALANYYGVTNWQNCQPNKGVKAYTYVQTGSYGGGFISQVLWVGTDADIAWQYWIELGYDYGLSGNPGLHWYWGRQRPGKTLAFWTIDRSISLYTWHWLRVQYVSNDSWGVYLDGDLVATCSPASPDSNVNCCQIESGLESWYLSGSLGTGLSWPNCAVNKEMQYYLASTGNWYMGLYDHHAAAPDYGHTSTPPTRPSEGIYCQWAPGTTDYSNIHDYKTAIP
jgi:hypothetical protein